MNITKAHINVLKGLADDSRLKIVLALRDKPLNAGEIENIIGKSQSSTSQQLKKMENAKILRSKKKGIMKYFEIRNRQIFALLDSLDGYVSVISPDETEIVGRDEKILVLGLSGSGKTSIIMNLTHINSIISEIKPTQGLKNFEAICKENGISLGNKELSKNYKNIYEYGGSIEDREVILSNPKKYLLNYDKVIFVIDIQNREGPIPYINAMNYLKDIMYALTDSQRLREFIILLHKLDPTLDIHTEFSDKYMNSKLINPIKKAMPPELNYRVYATNLVTNFRKELITRSFIR
ncbi:MAG: metalloregulator ArsR/SmtB family transcription factor [Candidatus Lokiarchaeota archaeon]|nr:metalloregulator ArsR/SmtB family transcription factor [Candidatus Lokiarchaeota archaeon]